MNNFKNFYKNCIKYFLAENFVPKEKIQTPMFAAAIKILNQIENELGKKAFIVGGSVRDILMDKDVHDVDIATGATPEEISKIFKTYDIGKSKDFGIVVVQQDGFDFEIAQFREDGEYTDGRRPDSVKKIQDFKGDSERRDFTINALAIDKNGEIVDYHGGIGDIQNKILKTVGNPDKRFQEDSLRILRLLRFAAKTGFTIEEKTLESAKKLSFLLKNISAERIRDEFFKSAESGKTLAKYVELLDEVGILEKILPEIYQMKDLKHNPKHHPEGGSTVFGHVIEAVKSSQSKNPIVNLGILFHDLGKTVTLSYKDGVPKYYGHEKAGVPLFNKIAERLKISNADKEAINFGIENHMHGHKLGELSDKMVLKLRQNPNWELLKDVIYSDEASRGEPLWNPEQYHKKIKRADDLVKKFGDRETYEKKMSELINGQKIMRLLPNIKGQKIGKIKEAVRNWIQDQNFNVSPEEIDSKILEFNKTIKESNFNWIVRNYLNYLQEDNTAGGTMSVFGDVSSTATPFSGDNYAKGDARNPKLLSKTVIRKNLPELTVFGSGISKNPKKGKKTKSKNKKNG